MEPKTLRTEVESLRHIFDDDELPWLALDRGVRSTICAMLDIALRSPDTAPDYVVREMISGLTSHLEKAQAAVRVLDRWAKEHNPNPW